MRYGASGRSTRTTLGPLWLSAQLIPREPSGFLAPVARHLVATRLEALAVAAGRADGVGQRDGATQLLHHARLALHDRPALRGMVADLEEATVHRNVVPVHVEHDDVAGGDPDHGIPRAAAQRVRARGADPGPALHLQAGRRDGAKIHGSKVKGRGKVAS